MNILGEDARLGKARAARQGPMIPSHARSAQWPMSRRDRVQSLVATLVFLDSAAAKGDKYDPATRAGCMR